MDGIPLSVPQMLDRAIGHGIPVVPGSAVVDESGWDFRVVHCTDGRGRKWILRSPRRAEVPVRAAVEARLLELLHGRLPVRLPEWRVHEPELTVYPRLPGSAAGTEHPETLRYRWAIDPLARTADYLGALGRVLVTLHSVPARDAIATGVPEVSARLSRERAERELREADEVFGLPAERYRRWRRWLADDAAWPAETVLVHGDVHPGHTLVTRTPDGGGRLSGLLDWTNSQLGDPALDFVDMYYAGGPDVLDALLRAYREHGGRVPEGMRDRIVMRGAFLWVHVALLGRRTDRPNLVNTAAAHLLGAAP
ncbi:macrolide 2'-phosphotransferase [Streptomyces olivoreticuli]|uniref:macrolide 2'-phosphotransferase n=1 Tax=Streptomyces olivoreticuli TaxID=68246 RepID=UPI001F086712|nr:macrolide 2'-phosphotransferase [Streptomyces olivoreticuli]